MARRSVLFTPGDRPEMLRKAPNAGADVIVFDLEDAVAPDRKAEARETVRSVLTDPAFDPDCTVCVRINTVGEQLRSDLEAVITTESRLDALMLPKVGGEADVRDVVTRLESHDRVLPIFALIESAAGVLRAEEIARVPETTALVFGAEDLAAEIGATRTQQMHEVLYARQRVVIAASAAGCSAIDTVYTDFEDSGGLREETSVAARFGFDGKLAIHPAQVEPINDGFTPDSEEVAWAERVVAAEREAAAEDRGVFEVDGEMIDRPLVARAERILRRAGQI